MKELNQSKVCEFSKMTKQGSLLGQDSIPRRCWKWKKKLSRIGENRNGEKRVADGERTEMGKLRKQAAIFFYSA